jgi:thioredoxin:protein disulfide reductase
VALARGQPVLLDFYADWCVECKRMDRTTWRDPAVIAALESHVWLKADVTANGPAERALLKRFGLIGPPATLFFADDGSELSERRAIGYIAADDMLRLIGKGAN